AADIIKHGYKPHLNAFTAAYDGEDIDASTLYVGLTGFLEPDDPRFHGTVEAVERHLKQGPLVYRYHYDDGLPGAEGGFILCTAWLIESYLLLGRVDEARQLFEEMLQFAGPTGLMPEEFELGRHPRGLGNHPQAYSHIGVIECALRLDSQHKS